MRRLAPAVLAAAILLAAAPAAAYLRSTDECGVCFWWPSRAVPFVVNPPDDPAVDGVVEASCGGSPGLDAVRLGFDAWSAPGCTDLALADAGLSTSTFVGYAQGGANENLVVFRRGACQDLVGTSDPCWSQTSGAGTCDNVHNCFLLDKRTTRSTIALTTVTYSPADGRILDADMELVAWDGAAGTIPQNSTPADGWYFTCAAPGPAAPSRCAAYGDTGCFSMDLQNTVTHEAGHFIGLAHPCENGTVPGVPNCASVPAAVAETTMYPSAAQGEVTKRTLDPDDVAGLCAIYPAGAASPTCPRTCADPSSGCGCGTATPGGSLAALLGLAALAPRVARRRRAAQDTITLA